MAQDARQQVIEVVCDAAGQLAQGAQPLALGQALLGLPQLVVTLEMLEGQARLHRDRLDAEAFHCQHLEAVLRQESAHLGTESLFFGRQIEVHRGYPSIAYDSTPAA
jgi:hypothetical protein